MLSLDSLNQMSPADFVQALGSVFEHSPWIAERASRGRPFSSIAALHRAMVDVVRSAPLQEQLALLHAHPELAGKEADAGTLTCASKVEQSDAGLNGLSAEEYARVKRLNAAYREKFGFPFIIAVRNHDKNSMLQVFEKRLGRDAYTEREAACAEVFKIAGYRLEAMLGDGVESGSMVEPKGINARAGQLTTHVLDTATGLPAAGMRVDLFTIDDTGNARPLSTAYTNKDGRTDQAMLAGEAFMIGRYELLFHVGAYFAGAGIDLPDLPFLDQVPVRFAIADASRHYHVPLLVTPWSYATYRGS